MYARTDPVILINSDAHVRATCLHYFSSARSDDDESSLLNCTRTQQYAISYQFDEHAVYVRVCWESSALSSPQSCVLVVLACLSDVDCLHLYTLHPIVGLC